MCISLGWRARPRDVILIGACVGIASLFALAREYDTTTGVINNLTSKCVLGGFLREERDVMTNTPSDLQLEHLLVGTRRYLCRHADAPLWAITGVVLVSGEMA